MLAVEDAIFALEWAKDVGGLEGLQARCTANAEALNKIVAERDWLGHLAIDKGTRSKTSVCLTVEGADADFIKKFAALLEKEDAAYDIAGYRDAPLVCASGAAPRSMSRTSRLSGPGSTMPMRRSRPRPSQLNRQRF
jgi:phosphoserine aminotransferase